MRAQLACRLVCLTTLALCSLAPLAADRIFVQFPGIPGESTDPGHMAWVDAYALNHAVQGGGGLGAPQFEGVAILKGTDRATPGLHQALAQGAAMSVVRIDVCREGASPGAPLQCYYRLQLENARLGNINLAGSSCVDPQTSCTPAQTESVTLDFNRITYTHIQFDASGNPTTTTETCWSLQNGAPC